MHDDWRLRIELSDEQDARELGHGLESGGEQHAAGAEFADKVIVSVDGPELFAYAKSRQQAEDAAQLIRTIAGEHGWNLPVELSRWHPEAEAWESPDRPLPSTPEEIEAEHEELVARERADSETQGFPEWEVRIQCQTHGETVKLAEILSKQHLSVVRRWRYLLIGADDEESARALADRITQETVPGTTITVEATLAEIAAETPPSRFAFLRGIFG